MCPLSSLVVDKRDKIDGNEKSQFLSILYFFLSLCVVFFLPPQLCKSEQLNSGRLTIVDCFGYIILSFVFQHYRTRQFHLARERRALKMSKHISESNFEREIAYKWTLIYLTVWEEKIFKLLSSAASALFINVEVHVCRERCPAEHVKIPSKRTTINQRRRPWPSSSKCVREKELFRKHVLVSFCCALLLEFLHRPRDRRQWKLFFDESCILSASLFFLCCVHGTFISFTCCLLVRSSMICVFPYGGQRVTCCQPCWELNLSCIPARRVYSLDKVRPPEFLTWMELEFIIVVGFAESGERKSHSILSWLSEMHRNAFVNRENLNYLPFLSVNAHSLSIPFLFCWGCLPPP